MQCWSAPFNILQPKHVQPKCSPIWAGFFARIRQHLQSVHCPCPPGSSLPPHPFFLPQQVSLVQSAVTCASYTCLRLQSRLCDALFSTNAVTATPGRAIVSAYLAVAMLMSTRVVPCVLAPVPPDGGGVGNRIDRSQKQGRHDAPA